MQRGVGESTFYGRQDDPGVVVGDDVGVAVLGLVDLKVGVFPGELLPRVDGLDKQDRDRTRHSVWTRKTWP